LLHARPPLRVVPSASRRALGTAGVRPACTTVTAFAGPPPPSRARFASLPRRDHRRVRRGIGGARLCSAAGRGRRRSRRRRRRRPRGRPSRRRWIIPSTLARYQGSGSSPIDGRPRRGSSRRDCRLDRRAVAHSSRSCEHRPALSGTAGDGRAPPSAPPHGRCGRDAATTATACPAAARRTPLARERPVLAAGRPGRRAAARLRRPRRDVPPAPWRRRPSPRRTHVTPGPSPRSFLLVPRPESAGPRAPPASVSRSNERDRAVGTRAAPRRAVREPQEEGVGIGRPKRV
jgi:hypothetical protein